MLTAYRQSFCGACSLALLLSVRPSLKSLFKKHTMLARGILERTMCRWNYQRPQQKSRLCIGMHDGLKFSCPTKISSRLQTSLRLWSYDAYPKPCAAAQEISEKAPQLPQDIKWHFIGHLQSNKAKAVVGMHDCMRRFVQLYIPLIQ